MLENIVEINEYRDRYTVYYQKTSEQLIFATNLFLNNKIIAWNSNIVVDDKTIDYLINSATGNPNLTLDFIFRDDRRIYSRVYHPIVQAAVLEVACYGVTTDLAGREEQPYHHRFSMERNIIVKVNLEMYGCLQDWQHWVEEDAITSRYVYRFTDNSTYDLEFLTVYDTRMNESIAISYNSYTGDIFINKSLPEILGADWWSTM
jgi:hypothetical protein